MRKIVMMLIVVGACGGTSDTPSCQQAMQHFYSSDCFFFHSDGNGGTTPIAEADALNICEQSYEAAPANCTDKLDTWVNCLDATPPSASNSECDCSRELMAVQDCK